MPLLSTFGAASARAFGNLSGIILPSDSLWNTVSFLSHFDGTNNGVNNVFDDGSTSNHTITTAGNVTQGSFGPFARPDGEWGAAFDGSTTGYISVPTDSDFDLTDATTLEFWVFIPEDQTDGYVLGRLNTYWFAAPDGSRNTFTFMCMDTSTSWNYIHSSANIVYNQWYFVQLIYSGGTATFYLDGVSQGTATFTSKTGQSQPFYVGGYAGQLNAKATVSNIRFSNVARSTSVPTAPFAIDSNTKLLLCSSNRFTDRSSQAAVVSSYAGASVSAFGPFLTSEVYDPAVNGASVYINDAGALSLGTSTDFNFGTADFTVEAFIKYEGGAASGDDSYVISFGGGSGSSGHFGINIYQGGWRVGAFNNDLVSGTAPTDKAWHHVAMVYQSNVFKFYVDGVLIGTAGSNGPFNTTTAVTISSYFGDTSYGNFVGYISDVRVVKGTAVYTSAFTPPTAPLTAITNTKLLLNMADGQAIDSAAQNNLTLYGNAKLSTTQAKFGDTSIYFDGTGDYAYVYPKYFTFGTGDFTVEFQVYFNSTALQSILSFLSADDTVAPHFYYHNSIINFYVGDVGVPIASGTINTGQWYHVALSRSGTSSKLFIDGTQAGNTYSDSNNYVAGPLSLGTYKWPTPSTASMLNGYIDEVRISKMARYTSNFTAPAEPFADKGQ